jgi:hypothetical protein
MEIWRANCLSRIFFSKTRGLNGIPVKGLGYRLIFEKLRSLNANWRGI